MFAGMKFIPSLAFSTVKKLLFVSDAVIHDVFTFPIFALASKEINLIGNGLDAPYLNKTPQPPFPPEEARPYKSVVPEFKYKEPYGIFPLPLLVSASKLYLFEKLVPSVLMENIQPLLFVPPRLVIPH